MTRTSLALCLAVILAACGGDSSGPPAGPENVQILSGSPQTGPAGGSPPLALRVVVTGSGGQPFPGAQVSWQVTGGGGSVNPASSTSDANGHATTIVTLGAPGLTSVRASVSNLTPVTFQVTSINPCAYLGPFREDTTVAGELRTTDCNFGDGSFVDFYGLQLSAQRTVVFSMTAAPVNAYLWLWEGRPLVAFDNNSGGGTNARLKAILGAGSYDVGANSLSASEVGSYTVSSSSTPTTTVVGCEDVWVSGGVVVAENIASTDCFFTDTASMTYYSDLFLLFLLAGESVTIMQSSQTVDPFLSLYVAGGGLVISDDDGGGGTSARLTYTAADSVVLADTLALYILDVGTALPNQTGAYTLSIGSISGRAPPLAAPLRFEARPHQRLDRVRLRLGRLLRRP